MQFRNDTNPAHRAFYVSAIDADTRRAARMAGPFDSHEEARSALRAIRDAAYDIDPRAHWWLWGTCSLPEHDGRQCPLTLNDAKQGAAA